MAAKPSSLYENLLEISSGKLDVFTRATDLFVKVGKDTNISQDAPTGEEAVK